MAFSAQIFTNCGSTFTRNFGGLSGQIILSDLGSTASLFSLSVANFFVKTLHTWSSSDRTLWWLNLPNFFRENDDFYSPNLHELRRPLRANFCHRFSVKTLPNLSAWKRWLNGPNLHRFYVKSPESLGEKYCVKTMAFTAQIFTDFWSLVTFEFRRSFAVKRTFVVRILTGIHFPAAVLSLGCAMIRT